MQHYNAPASIVEYVYECCSQLKLIETTPHAAIAFWIRYRTLYSNSTRAVSLQLEVFACLDLVCKHLWRIPMQRLFLQSCHKSTLDIDGLYAQETRVLSATGFRVWTEDGFVAYVARASARLEKHFDAKIVKMWREVVEALCAMVWLADLPHLDSSSPEEKSRLIACGVLFAAVKALTKAEEPSQSHVFISGVKSIPQLQLSDHLILQSQLICDALFAQALTQ
jgi:hypothetical protein